MTSFEIAIATPLLILACLGAWAVLGGKRSGRDGW